MILLVFQKLRTGVNVDNFIGVVLVFVRKLNEFQENLGGGGRIVNRAVVIFKTYAETLAYRVKRVLALVRKEFVREL